MQNEFVFMESSQKRFYFTTEWKAILKNISRTTWEASAYHQWYAFHKLVTPDLK